MSTLPAVLLAYSLLYGAYLAVLSTNEVKDKIHVTRDMRLFPLVWPIAFPGMVIALVRVIYNYNRHWAAKGRQR